jgi:hypothetical protein
MSPSRKPNASIQEIGRCLLSDGPSGKYEAIYCRIAREKRVGYATLH